jgi:hypothetical protein
VSCDVTREKGGGEGDVSYAVRFQRASVRKKNNFIAIN